MNYRMPVFLVTSLLGCTLSFSSMAGEAEKPAEPVKKTEEAKPDAKVVDDQKIPAVLPVKLSEHEAQLHSAVTGAFPKDGKGGRSYFNGRKLKMLSLRQSVLHALEKNLTIMRQGKFEEVSKSALEKAKAVFDPVFSASVTYNRFEKFDRKETARRFRTATEPFDLNGNGVIDPNEENVLILDKEAQDQSAIFALVFRDPRPAGFIKDTQQASRESAEGPAEDLAYSFSVSQQLPWGNQVGIGYTARRKETYFLKGFRVISPGTREYGRPWSSSITLNLLVPAPFMKDFGRNSGAETGVDVAEFAKERAYWDTKTVINSTLLFVDLAYWDIAGTLESLRATIDNRKLLEAQMSAVEERLKAGRTTDYSMQQTKARLASVKSSEEVAWASYHRASNALVNLLDLDETTVIFPAGYSEFGTEKLSTAEDEIVATGLATRPEIQAEKTSKKISIVLLDFAENQKRPNLKLNFTYGFSQVLEQLFGYRSLEDSFMSITSPDTIDQTYSATYLMPWRNRALESAHRQAGYALNQQKITVRDTENLVEQQLSDALVLYLSSKKAHAIATETFKKAKEAYNNAKTLYDANRLTEFEIISKSSDLLNADLDFVSASVSFKKAEANLLGAQGILAAYYADRSSDGALLDKVRLKKIAESKPLEFFPQPKPKTQPDSVSAETVAVENE